MKSLYDYLKKHKKRKKAEKERDKLFEHHTSTSNATGSVLSFEEMNKMIEYEQGFSRQTETSREQLNEAINRRIQQAEQDMKRQERKDEQKIKDYESRCDSRWEYSVAY